MKTMNMKTITKCACALALAAWLAAPAHAGELHGAAEHNDADKVRALIAQGARVDELDDDGRTPLYRAVQRGSWNPDGAIRALLEHGADPNLRMPRGESALHRAAADSIREKVVAALLEYGGDPDLPDAAGNTALDRAFADGSLESITVLLEAGATLDSARWFAPTAGSNYLHVAASHGKPRAVRAFIAAGAPLDVRDGRGWTAVHHATSQVNLEALSALLAGEANPDVRDNEGETALHIAIGRSGAHPAQAALLKAGADPMAPDRNGTPAVALTYRKERSLQGSRLRLFVAHMRNSPNPWLLGIAAHEGDFLLVRALIDAGTDLAAPGEGGITALHRAAQAGHTLVVEALIDAGADPEGADDAGRRALHFANAARTDGAALMLLARGADATARTNNGSTPLHYAWRHATVARALLAAGAEPNEVNERGRTPLHVAAGRRAGVGTMTVLLEAGADPNAADSDGNNPLHWTTGSPKSAALRRLLEAGTDPSARNALGRTPSDAATARGNHEMHRTLKGWVLMSEAAAGRVDMRTNDRLGNTALHWAADFDSVETAETLLAEGADPNAQNTRGLTPLHIATRSPRMLKVLLDGGASVNLAGQGGVTALHYAAGEGAMESIAVLLEAGANPFARDARGAMPARWAGANKHVEAAALLRAATKE